MTMDSRALLTQIEDRYAEWEAERLADTEVTLWDGDYTLRGEMVGHLEEEFEFIERDTGTAKITISVDHYLAKWVTDHMGREKKNVHIRFRRQGAQWDGRMEFYRLSWSRGEVVLEIFFKHAYEELKHIICWSNPFTPAELQFPRVWMLFGKTMWIASFTLWVNLFRIESNIWSIPGDPFDEDEWFNFDQTNWDIVVCPVNFATDTSPPAVLFSRFRDWHTVTKKMLADAQISVECFRYFNGDPQPAGLGFTPKHGALVVRLVDNSGWQSGTSFFGSILTGLVRAFTSIAGDGFTQNIQTIPGDLTFPEEYYQQDWRGTLPEAPHAVIEDGPETGIVSSEFEYYPATDISHIFGGHSMPGVNEGISLAVTLIGNFIGSMITIPGFGIGLSGLGAAVDAVARPLYTDTIMAFQHWKAHDRAADLGEYYYKERIAGTGQAYTLGAFAALRAGMFDTRERVAHKVTISDAAPLRIGYPGHGDIWVGSRVATRVRGMQPEDRLFVEQVTKLKWFRDEKGQRGWDCEIGYKEPSDPFLTAMEIIADLGAGLTELGM